MFNPRRNIFLLSLLLLIALPISAETNQSPQWKKLDTIQFDLSNGKLKQLWPKLHQLDQHPFPTPEVIAQQIQSSPKLLKIYGQETKTFTQLANDLQKAWQSLHEGNLEAGYKQALALGPIGYYPAGHALYLNGYYLMDDDRVRQQQLVEVSELMEKGLELEPNNTSLIVLYCYSMGRHLEEQPVKLNNVNKYGRLKKYSEQILEKNPHHLGAMLMLASLHAKGAAKAPTLSKLYFGLTKQRALSYYEQAFAEDKELSLGLVSYADNILRLEPDDGRKQAIAALEKSLAVVPIDSSGYLVWQDAHKKMIRLQHSNS